MRTAAVAPAGAASHRLYLGSTALRRAAAASGRQAACRPAPRVTDVSGTGARAATCATAQLAPPEAAEPVSQYAVPSSTAAPAGPRDGDGHAGGTCLPLGRPLVQGRGLCAALINVGTRPHIRVVACRCCLL